MTDSSSEDVTLTFEETPTVAVTGAAGYIGSRVIDQLQSAHPDWEIIALDNQYRGQVTSIGDVDIAHVDIRNRRRVERTLAGSDVVLHLAAISGVEDCTDNADLAYEVNVTGTNNIAWFCRKTETALAFPFSMAVLGNPTTFPITADLPRDPLNWYGRTKLLGERSVESFAEGSFPAHTFMKSNLYGEHVVDETVVSKPAVISFFVDRVLSGEPLTVYEPGTQSRNFVHVKDVARAYVKSTQRLLEQLERGETGVETYEIAGSEDPSILEVAKTVQRVAEEDHGIDVDVELVENPRSGETLVDSFTVDTSKATELLHWEPQHTIEQTVCDLLNRNRQAIDPITWVHGRPSTRD